MKALGIVAIVLVSGLGGHVANTMTPARASTPTYGRVMQTITLRDYVCDVHKPQMALMGPHYFAAGYCLLGAIPLRNRPVSMSYEWQAVGFRQWWSSAGTVPEGMGPWDLRNRVHLAWINNRVVLFGPMTTSEGTPNYATRLPNTTIQFEAVYQSG